MKNKWIIGLAAAAAVLAAAPEVYAAEQGQNLIEDNIFVADINVGGLNEQQALARVNEYVDSLKAKPFTLDYEGNQVEITAGDMGLYWSDEAKVSDVVDIGKTGNLIDRYKVKKDLEHENIKIDITLDVDENKIERLISDRLSVYNVAPKNYGLKRENGEFVITDGNTGISLKAHESAQAVADYITGEWDREGTATIKMQAEVTEPESTKESLALVKDVLGTFTTDFSSSSAGRATNVRVGASKIDGTVLYPGEELSVYDLVNPMTAENGYELAGSYENGTTVQTYGGGMCQVSSTLYNAAIRAELRIEERYCHSMIVTYVQPSMDAAIAGTYKNLRFSNPYDDPVYIEGYTYGGQITFNVYGHETRPANRKVSFESETISEIQPELQVNAVSKPIGHVATVQSAHIGKGACLWKIVTVDGEEVSRDVFNRSTYNASPKIIEVGVASENPEAVAQINAAIATRDEATIRNTAAALAAAAVEEPEEEPEEEESEEVEETGTDKKDKDKKKDKNKDKDKDSEKAAEQDKKNEASSADSDDAAESAAQSESETAETEDAGDAGE